VTGLGRQGIEVESDWRPQQRVGLAFAVHLDDVGDSFPFFE
jgi:hypothetical protein